MAILPACPSCGLESPEVRCPRCNTLKLIGCDGACSHCASSCSSGPVSAPPAPHASDEVADDAGRSGTRPPH